MQDNNTVVVRYIMAFPNGNKIIVYIYENGLATINGVPAKELKTRPDMVKLLTAEGEIYEFTSGGERD